MTNRPPAAPPRIPGLTHLQHLGSGGFADVFLYEDDLLGRKVAVKVLLPDHLDADVLRYFTNEANLMARLSNHPSIVTVYQAAVSSDGRPFLVMEYCSRPNLHARFRSSRFSELETLRLGIQIAGAVETAHRARILHRDIKPANILVTDYGRPALTDFGIASVTGDASQSGLSVPWASPEALAGEVGDVRSDVYSLAATLYTVLAGRSPFEIRGASNTTTQLVERIAAGDLPSIGRPDVSSDLESVLGQALDHRPENRQPSAIALAHALQRVQIARGLPPTSIDVIDEEVEHEDPDDEAYTQLRSPATVSSGRPFQSMPAYPPGSEPDVTVAAHLPRAMDIPAAADLAEVEQTALRPSSPSTGRWQSANPSPWGVAAPVPSVPVPPTGEMATSGSSLNVVRPKRNLVTVAAIGLAALLVGGATVYASGVANQGGGAVGVVARPDVSSPAASPAASEPAPDQITAAPTGFACWDSSTTSQLKNCPAPKGKAQDYKYLLHAFPSIAGHQNCEKRDSSNKSDYTHTTVMWDCELGSALLRYRYWESAKDGKRHYSRKYSVADTKATFDLYLAGKKVSGWAKESRHRYVDAEKGTSRFVTTIWLPKQKLSLSAEGDTRKAMRKALTVIRIVPLKDLRGSSAGAEAPALVFKLKKR